ncbi:MAG: PIG-L family deacetylase [Pyrinomonadaceae bacterium]
MRRSLTRLTALFCSFAVIASTFVLSPAAFNTRAQVRAIYSNGAGGLAQLLRRLQTTASALHTGAHPDDEDSALIARLARGDQARVAYLSLNRGEGGQNIISSDLFEPLGVIRTEELLQARRLDGGEQFFTRTFDYGFTKTREEAARKWGEREVLGDMVRIIRLYRPLIIIARFTGTPSDGHGHHQLSGYLTPLAFRAAADPKEFPEQLAEGLRTWQALKLYVSQSFTNNPNNKPTLQVETGRYDPLLGRTYYEIAIEGRSQHKSQEQGSIEPRGAHESGVRLLQSLVKNSEKNSEPEQTLFDGIDTSITGIAKTSGLREGTLKDELAKIQRAAARALADYDALAPQKIIKPLAEGLEATRKAREKLAATNEDANPRADADLLLSQKEREFADALQHAAGVTVDALADAETVAHGEAVAVAVRVFAPDTSLVRIGEIRLRAPQNWRTEPSKEPTASNDSFSRFRRETAQQSAYFRLNAPADAPLTQPYWLTQPRDGDVFQWPADAPKGLPFAPPQAAGEVKMEIGGASVVATKPVEYRYADPVRGEIRRELNVVPALSVALASNLVIVPTSVKTQTRRIAVRLANNSRLPISGQVRLHLPDGWIAQPAAAAFEIKERNARTAIVFNVSVPGHTKTGSYQIAADAVAGGQTFNREMHIISFPHIQTHRLYQPAEATVRVFDLQVAPVRVGYIMGSGDEVPEAIRRMGVPVTLLDEDELSTGDLSRYDTIVVGVRASQVRPDFTANNARLMEYVRGGGTLIVQYQRPDYVEKNLAPLPAKIGPRVTDENAVVTVLQPQHPAFNFPNKITADDWKDWRQERSLYNMTTLDAGYVPLLESHDPGEPAQNGGEVYAELGRGKYVYTSYAWFRELPEGVPGAYRLFANLLSLAKAPGARSINGAQKASRR